jgi:peptidoglycan hydrolase-like protein with peptidoglycan-binding domain
MTLQSQLFRGDPKLEAAAVSDPAHIVLGARGEHVRKIQLALIQLDGAAIAPDGVYGPATAAAVLAFKQKRNIINRAIQTTPDNIVGKMTIAAMDDELLDDPIPDARSCILLPATPIDVGGLPIDVGGSSGVSLAAVSAPAVAGPTSDAIMAAAFRASRSTVGRARDKLFDLANTIRDNKPLSPTLRRFLILRPSG